MAIYNEFMPQEQGGLRAAEAKRRIAQALRQQGQMPQGQMVGGIYVAPAITQFLASGLNQYQGNRLERDALQQEQDIYNKRGQTISEASKRFAEALKPREVQTGENVETLPFEPSQMDRFGSPMQGQTQQQVRTPIMSMQNPTTQDIFNAQAQFGTEIGSPEMMMQAYGNRANLDIQNQRMQQEQAFRSQEAQLQREARQQELLMRIEDNRLTREQQNQARRELAEMNLQGRREIAGMMAANKQQAQPYYQALPTAQGYARFNARTGQMEPIEMGGGNVLPAAQDPKLQADIVAAKEQAKTDIELGAESKKAIKKSDQLLSAAKQAEKLLDSGPTASGAGAAVDYAGRIIGASPESAQTAAQLETLSGWMVANVPRMEGPQSNFDVQNYQVMAGKIGDRTVPIAERKKALKTLIELQKKYKTLNQDNISENKNNIMSPTEMMPSLDMNAINAELARRRQQRGGR